jgi:hypothetical protein
MTEDEIPDRPMKPSEQLMALLGKPKPVFTPEFEAQYRQEMDEADERLARWIERRRQGAA